MQKHMVGMLILLANILISAGTATVVTFLLIYEYRSQQADSSYSNTAQETEIQRFLLEQMQEFSHRTSNVIIPQDQEDDETLAQRQQEAEAKAQRQRFTNIVKKRVEQAWIIPPGANINAAVTLNIQLGPSGEVLGASVVSSSGDDDFDRSAQQAVEKAAPFSKLRDVPAEFQRNLRQLTLRFTPWDVR